MAPSEAETGRIIAGVWESLGEIDGHLDVAGVLRWSVLQSPTHVAVHRVESPESSAPYSLVHRHDDEGELNLILAGDADLVYEIVLGDERRTVTAPSAVWIPPGTDHSANAIEGVGYLVCIRFPRS